MIDQGHAETAMAVDAAIVRVARESYGKLMAMLAARTRDLHAAEDALGDAFAAALRTWPRDGVPINPDAWILVAARRRLIDHVRRNPENQASDTMDRMLAFLPEVPEMEEIPDERLKLLFTCAHPAIDAAVRAPLMLQVVLGLDIESIAGAFIVSPAAMRQRLIRAKRKIRDAGIEFAEPAPEERMTRLGDVLAAIYAAYGAAWDDHVGDGSAAPPLAAEARQLTDLAARLMPQEPEVHGLVSLLCACEARRGARRDGRGRYVPLSEQDCRLWDAALLAEAEASLRRAAKFAQPGRFQIEAAIQSAHIDRVRHGVNSWPAIVGFYELLLVHAPSIGASLGRAAALAEWRGPELGLAAVEELEGEWVAAHQPYWALRGHLMARLGRSLEARAAYRRAIGLSGDEAVRLFLAERWESLKGA